MPVRVMKAMGIQTLLVTNAAGGINTDFNVISHIFLLSINKITTAYVKDYG